VYIYIYIHICIYIYIFKKMHFLIHEYIFAYTKMYMYMCVCIHNLRLAAFSPRSLQRQIYSGRSPVCYSLSINFKQNITTELFMDMQIVAIVDIQKKTRAREYCLQNIMSFLYGRRSDE